MNILLILMKGSLANMSECYICGEEAKHLTNQGVLCDYCYMEAEAEIDVEDMDSVKSEFSQDDVREIPGDIQDMIMRGEAF